MLEALKASRPQGLKAPRPQGLKVSRFEGLNASRPKGLEMSRPQGLNLSSFRDLAGSQGLRVTRPHGLKALAIRQAFGQQALPGQPLRLAPRRRRRASPVAPESRTSWQLRAIVGSWDVARLDLEGSVLGPIKRVNLPG